jgi:multidrug resistance efflux pump
MMVFLTLIYVAVLVLLIKLKVIRLTLWWKLSPAVWMLLLFIVLFIPMQWGAPSGNVTQYQFVVEIVPNVSGTIIEVPIEGNRPLKKGDVLFKIDPRPYQYRVDQVKAALAEAEQAVPQLEAAWKAAVAATARAKAQRGLAKLESDMAKKTRGLDSGAISKLKVAQERQKLKATEAALDQAQSNERKAKLAYESEIDGINTKVAQLQAQLKETEYDLDQTAVVAPADGYTTGVTLRPGQRVGTVRAGSVLNYVVNDQTTLAAWINQINIRHVKPGQPAEVALQLYPGKTLKGTVDSIVLMSRTGQLEPSGEVPEQPIGPQPPGQYIVILKIEDEADLPFGVPGGAIGTAAIYTESARVTQVIRKVMVRMQAWMNYIIP